MQVTCTAIYFPSSRSWLTEDADPASIFFRLPEVKWTLLRTLQTYKSLEDEASCSPLLRNGYFSPGQDLKMCGRVVQHVTTTVVKKCTICSLNYTILGAGVCWWLIRSESQGTAAFSCLTLILLEPASSALVLLWSVAGAQMRLCLVIWRLKLCVVLREFWIKLLMYAVGIDS